MPPSDIEKPVGQTGVDFAGDPQDQSFVMNRKFARLSGDPKTMVDRDFQRLQRQSPRTLLQNVPTPLAAVLRSAARGRRKKQ